MTKIERILAQKNVDIQRDLNDARKRLPKNDIIDFDDIDDVLEE